MKVLITGGNGQLGEAFKRSYTQKHELVFFSRSAFDLNNEDQMNQVLLESNADALINCAAYTNVELAESEKDLAFEANAFGAERLAKACLQHGVKLLHVSTDYVFDGGSTTPYSENDQPHPINEYGRSKAQGEQLVLSSNAEALVVRVSWLYDFEGKNFLNTMRKLAFERGRVSVVNDQISSPVYAGVLAADLLLILEQALTKNISGCFHYRHEGSASWYDFAAEIFKVFEIDAILEAVDSGAFPTKAQRPRYSLLSTEKLRCTFDLSKLSWKEALKRCHEDELKP